MPVLPPIHTVGECGSSSGSSRSIVEVPGGRVAMESPIKQALESFRAQTLAVEPSFKLALESFRAQSLASAKAVASVFDAIQPMASAGSLFAASLQAKQEASAKVVASMLDAIQPPAFTLPPMRMFSNDQEQASISRLVIPSEHGRPSVTIHRTFMLETYGEIFDLENEVRRFIVQKLSETYGRDWVKHQIPGEMYDEWKKRRDRAVNDGEVAGPLINYADFGDYVRIILRRDNWENVFKSYFHSKESVQESFRRIHPVRRSTM